MIDDTLTERLKAIKLVAMDVDGTYTGGHLFYDSQGSVSKGFHCHDGFAMEILRLGGILRGFITGRMDNATRERATYLKVDFILDNTADKEVALQSLQKKYGLGPHECLYIGDDINDIPAFEAAGIRVAVANAVNEVKARADFVTTRAGGDGAVREVADMIVAAKGIDPVALWLSHKTMPGTQHP